MAYYGNPRANYGAAPYQESAFKVALRNLIAGSAGIGAGLGAVRPGSNFADAFLQSAGRSSLAVQQASQAAQEYALRQEESRRRREMDVIDTQYKEALIKNLATEKPPAIPSKRQDYEDLIGNGVSPVEARQIVYGLTMEEQAKQKADTKQPETGLVQISGPDGTPIWVRPSTALGKPAVPREKPVTGVERTALAFYNRAKSANDSITNPGSKGISLEDEMASLPLPQQARLRYAPNVLQSPSQQVYRQAQRAFTEARLRKESGAAIPLQEYENDARTYFAQPGDSQRTIKAKRAARQVVLKGLKFSAGKAYDEYYGGADAGGGGAADLIYNPQTGELEPAQ